MLLARKFLLLLSFVFLVACEHGTAIDGLGDIVAVIEPSRSCTAAQGECRFKVAGNYEEGYYAVAGPQHLFVKWDVCLVSDGVLCIFNIGASTVEQNFGKSFTSTKATFEAVSSTRFDAVWEGTGQRNGIAYTMSCISLANNTLRCEGAEDGDDMFFAVALTINGNNIVAGAGRGLSAGGALTDVSVQSGSFVAHSSLQLSLIIDGDPASLDLVFEDAYRVPRPIVVLAGEYESSETGNAMTFADNGSFSITEGGEPSCAITGTMLRPAALGHVAMFDLTMTRQNCATSNGAMVGFAYEFNFDDQAMLYVYAQQQALNVNNGGIYTHIVQLGDEVDSPL